MYPRAVDLQIFFCFMTARTASGSSFDSQTEPLSQVADSLRELVGQHNFSEKQRETFMYLVSQMRQLASVSILSPQSLLCSSSILLTQWLATSSCRDLDCRGQKSAYTVMSRKVGTLKGRFILQGEQPVGRSAWHIPLNFCIKGHLGSKTTQRGTLFWQVRCLAKLYFTVHASLSLFNGLITLHKIRLHIAVSFLIEDATGW